MSKQSEEQNNNFQNQVEHRFTKLETQMSALLLETKDNKMELQKMSVLLHKIYNSEPSIRNDINNANRQGIENKIMIENNEIKTSKNNRDLINEIDTINKDLNKEIDEITKYIESQRTMFKAFNWIIGVFGINLLIELAVVAFYIFKKIGNV